MRAFHLSHRKFYSLQVFHTTAPSQRDIKKNPKPTLNRINSYWKNIKATVATCLTLYFLLLAL